MLQAQRLALRTLGARCALLHHGYIVEVAGDPRAETVEVDDPATEERVRQVPNPDHAAALALGLLPLPGAVLTQTPVGAVRMEGRGEVSVGAYRFTGHMAAALRAACIDSDRPRDPESRLIHRRQIPRTNAGAVPLGTGGLRVSFTAVSDLSPSGAGEFNDRCAIVSELGRMGWTRALHPPQKTAHERAARDLVDEGLLQKIDDDSFTSTRALRINQFATHLRGSTLEDPEKYPARLKTIADRIASLITP